MYVWIPRYKYQLWNAVVGETSEPQMINIEFEKNDYSSGEVKCIIDNKGKETCENALNGNWYTHPAFTFGDTELYGIWVGKFEPSDAEDVEGKTVNIIKEITILPNKVSMTMKNINVMFNASRKIEELGNKYKLNPNEIDTHMMKNMEWGAVAYLSSSKYGRYKDAETCIDSGCEVWLNNTVVGEPNDYLYYGTITGCSGTEQTSQAVFHSTSCIDNYSWEKLGVNASITGNIYGIYDMSGGMMEYFMGNVSNISGSFNTMNSGFTTPPKIKYYDKYEYDTSYLTHNRGHLGDATREIITINESQFGGWYNDSSFFPTGDIPWFERGSEASDGESVGIFALYYYIGNIGSNISFRVVLTAQDGNE